MLRWALVGPITLLALLAVTLLLLIRWLSTEVDWVDHTDLVISSAQETQALLLDMETGVRGYLLTHDKSFLAPYERAAPVMGTAFSEMRRLVADNPPQVATATTLEKKYRDWLVLVATSLPLAGSANVREDAQITAKEQMDAIRSGFARFIGVEERLRASRTASVRRVTRVVVATSTVVALLFGVITGLFTRRGLQAVATDFETALADSDVARVRAEALAVENERLYLQAQSASRAKDEFLATLSHELRTPLTAILGWSRLLQMRPAAPDDIENALAAIERSAKSQAALIEDILDVSRIITGKMRLDMQQIDLRDAVRQAVESLVPATSSKHITIDVEAPEALAMSADPNRMQQIIWNLLANSVKFSPSGTRILVDARRNALDIVLEVTDQGRGIESAFLPFVFDRFRQADGTFTREFNGLGIGLSVVKLLVELHGGTVRAESAGFEKGATFTVTLPARAIPSIAANSDARRQPVDDLIENAGRPLAGRDVLIVDDDIDTREVIAAMLRTFGGRVQLASSVREAMPLVTTLKFAVILTDIAMPAEDGFELLRRVRASPGPNSRTPVVAVTALAGSAFPDGSVNFAATIRKPVDPAVLATTVAAMIQ